MRLTLYMKLQFRPNDHFSWRILPGYPVEAADVRVERVLADITQLGKDWERHRRTMLFEMEQGMLLRGSGGRYSDSELRHAAERNPRPKFAGNIDHLQTTVMQEPVPGSGISKHYLVLYDTVPGGTGYLKELMQSTGVLREVFALALARLEACACNGETRSDGTPRDGCYRCLYAYRLSAAMADISRERATEILRAILEDWENLYAVRSIDEITIDPLIESELERLFLATLQEARHAGAPVVVKKEFFGHDSGYRVRVGQREYALLLQRSLGTADGVDVPSRADFLFRPLDPESPVRPVAVFTDGYEYHAAPGRGRIGTDLAQRMSLLRGGGFRVWSLTWEDLLHFGKKAPEANPFLETASAVLTKLLGHSSIPITVRALRPMAGENPLTQLLAYLADGIDADWERYAILHAMAGIEKRNTVSEMQSAARLDRLRNETDSRQLQEFVPTASGAVLHDEREIPVGDHGLRCGIVARVLPLAAAADPSRYADLRVMLRFHDGPAQAACFPAYRERWNQMLRAVNLYQFVPGFEAEAERN
jgi:DEAD/DEAH box helicase domain-containing protein